MNRHRRHLAVLAGLALFAGAVAPVIAQAPPAAAPPKLISPVRGQAEIGFTQPKPRREGNMVITTFKIMNLANGPIAGLKVDEFWYDKNQQLVGGAPSFRYRKPLMQNEIIDIELKTPVNPSMTQPQWKFEHANGAIKTTPLTEAQMKARAKTS
jgi:hypothetical protein